MWRKLSLRARLNTLLAFVLMLGLAINIARLVVEAGPRVRAEDQSVVRLAREFVETLAIGLNDTPDPEARLSRIIDDINRLRHVSITRETAAAMTPAVPPRPELSNASDADDERQAPAWFSALVHPEQTVLRVPITVNGKPESLQIASHPNDEMAEIWDDIVTQIQVGFAIAVALLLITMMVVNRALAPLQALANGMADIEAGAYDTRVEPGGSPELAAICGKLNHLAATLGDAMEEKRRLAERIVSLQDVERKEIARELHDEFGPYLFALRAHASALMQMTQAPEPGIDAMRRHGSAMLDQVNALQQFNRRILEKLRPVGLMELGLREALGALLRLWREAHPDVVIETTISPSLGETGDTSDLTIYRVVQEALTNVFRHAGATRIDVTIEPIQQSLASKRGATGSALVRVQDNGSGFVSDSGPGFGLIGMRERVMALGGSVTVASTSEGVTVEAIIPNGVRS
jgi:two-component system, NarL family, sensor histidine kinase UhpB